MKKENKRKVMLLVIGVAVILIACIGATYAYFTANIEGVGNNSVNGITAVLASATMDYGDKIEANGIYPGNKIVKTIHVIGSGPENAVPITANLIFTPDVTDFSDHIKYTLYAVENSTIKASEICGNPEPVNIGGMYYDEMECDTSNIGSPILEGIFSGTEEVRKEIGVTSKTNTTYYLLVEYVNDKANPQNEEQGKRFTINISCDIASEKESSLISYKIIVDGEERTNLPIKQDNYEVEVSCSDGVERKWNYDTWSLGLEEANTPCICSLNFKEKEEANKMTDYLITLAESSDELTYDGTVDNNLRYIGANPNNYVLFNNELWRIIGVMNNIEDSEGNIGTHIKIIRDKSMGLYWTGSNTNSVNDWTKSTLNTVQYNGTFYDSLISEAKDMISSVVWNLGGVSDTNYSAEKFYTLERGTSVYPENPTTWTGNIGLMYPSEVGVQICSQPLEL